MTIMIINKNSAFRKILENFNYFCSHDYKGV